MKKIQKIFDKVLLISLPLFSVFIMNPFGTNVYELPKFSFFLFSISLGLIFLVFSVLKKDKFKLVYNKYVILFLIFYVLSLIASMLFGTSLLRSFFGDHFRFQGVLAHIFYLIYFLIVLNFLDSKKKIEKFLKIILFLGFFTAIYAIFQLFEIGLFFDFSTIYLSGFMGKVFSFLGHPNFLGQILLIPIWINIYFLFKKKSNKLFYLTLPILITALIFTQNRASWLGLISGLIILFIFVVRISKSKKILLSSLFAISFPTLFFLIAPTIRSFHARFLIWESSIKMFFDHPFLGTGLSNFSARFQQYLDPKIYDFEPMFNVVDRSHNTLLDTLTMQGIFGLIPYLILIFIIVFNFQKIKRDKIATFLLIALCSVFISGMFSFNLVSHYIFIFAVLAILFRRILKFKSKPFVVSWPIYSQIVFVFLSSILTLVFSINLLASDALYLRWQKTNDSKSIIFASELNPLQTNINYRLANLLAANQKDEAYLYLEKAGKFSNFDFIYYLNCAFVEKEFGNIDNALKAFNKAETLAPNFPEILIYKAKYLFELEKYEESIETFEKLISIIPNYWKYSSEEIRVDLIRYTDFLNDSKELNSILYYLEEAYMQIGDFEKAAYYGDLIKKRREL